MPASQEELQDAIFDLHQYLSDQKPPLMVIDAIALLFEQDAPFLAAQIDAWVGSQSLAAPVADYLYHAAKKISLMGELDLFPRDVLAGHLRALTGALLPYAPDADRELLRQNFERLGQAAPVMVAAGVIHRQSGAQAAAAPTATQAEQALTREVRRLSLLLDHIRPLASPAAPPEQRTHMTSQFMTEAAVQATTSKELDQHLEPLRQLGIDTATEQVFRTLARSLAGWALPMVEGRMPVASRDQLQAMRQIVALADDPAEVAKRYRELVHAATEQFNEGHLGRAATMFELADRLATEQKVKPVYIEPVRAQGHAALDQDRLRKYPERADYRPQLRVVMSFFTALRPPALLQALNGEQRRERRHELLALLEAHEQAARSAAWELLKASVEPATQTDPFFQMNLVYLMRIIPRPAEAPVEEEVNVVTRTAGRSSPPPLVKQIIAYLASVRHEKAERALITYLKVFESMLLQPETAAYPPTEVEVLLDRTCAALARYGSPRAWRVLIDHGLKSEARLGSPFMRLAEAGRLDFSGSRDLVERIITALRAELPRRGLLGAGLWKSDDKAVSLVGALAGTPLPEVQAILKEIATNYPQGRLGTAAHKAMAALAAAAKPPASPGLSGDLELFGLPNLLQTLNQSTFTGTLSLMSAEGKTQAALVLVKGQLVDGQCGNVRGEESVFQLLEKPFPGTFAFVSRDASPESKGAKPLALFDLLMEGVRRHDEYKRAAAVAPDGARLKATDKPRTPVAGEDPHFQTLVWGELSSGKTPQQCEDAIATDAYRVRRLVAQWVEDGTLQPV